jgi:hypothetical protein
MQQTTIVPLSRNKFINVTSFLALLDRGFGLVRLAQFRHLDTDDAIALLLRFHQFEAIEVGQLGALKSRYVKGMREKGKRRGERTMARFAIFCAH